MVNKLEAFNKHEKLKILCFERDPIKRRPNIIIFDIPDNYSTDENTIKEFIEELRISNNLSEG